MPRVDLTVAQIRVVLSAIQEVHASGPEDWADATGRSHREAARDWAVLDRAAANLGAALNLEAPDAP